MHIPMLAMTGLGDAYGACFEYAAPSEERPNNLSGYHVNPTYPAIGGGRYTDDTQMAVAVSLTLLGGSLSRRAFADAFVLCYRRDPRPGYSRAMQGFIASCRDGADLLSRIRPDSDKSGAAMRACPIGQIPDEDEVLRVAELQARVTHDTPGGVAAAQAAALMAHAMLYGKASRQDLPGYVADRVPGPWAERWEGSVGPKGVDSVRAALWAVADHDHLSAVLRASVGYTGDVDTVAAIALGVACCGEDVSDDLPAALTTGLEDGLFGRRYLAELDVQLGSIRAPASAPSP